MTGASPDGLRSIGVLARDAAVLLLLAGVLAMHALISGHDAGLAWSTASAAGLSTAASVAAGPHIDDAVMGAHEVVTGSTAVTTRVLSEDSCAGCGDHQAPAHSGSHLLLEVCLAVSAGAALALLLLIGCVRRVTLLLAHRSMNVRAAVQALVGALRPPSLFNLCVLRT